MIFVAYKLHKATSGMMPILSYWKRKTPEGATSRLQHDTALSHIARNSIAYLRRDNVATLIRTYTPIAQI